MYVAAVNRCGFEATPGTDGLEFFGRSFISDPFGAVLAEAPSGEPAVLVAQCSREYLEQVRCTWPFFRDRRVDAYGALNARWLDEQGAK